MPALRVDPPNAGGLLDWRPLFGRPMDGYALEIGFGAGEHLVAQARANPEIGFLGCDPFINGMTTLLAEIETGGLTNIRIFPDDARLILGSLPPGSVDRCFVLFPDPWPKRRHRDRRLIGPTTLDLLGRALAGGAPLRLASDHPVMVDWMLFQCRRHPDFNWQATQPSDWQNRPDDWPPTRYEAKALHGEPLFLTFRRRIRV